jgi:hypothetical protein
VLVRLSLDRDARPLELGDVYVGLVDVGVGVDKVQAELKRERLGLENVRRDLGKVPASVEDRVGCDDG